jgi:hypothetical protein
MNAQFYASGEIDAKTIKISLSRFRGPSPTKYTAFGSGYGTSLALAFVVDTACSLKNTNETRSFGS